MNKCDLSECVRSDSWSLYISFKGELLIFKLVHKPTGQVWADGPLVYRVQTGQNGQSVLTNLLKGATVETGRDWLTITGQAQHLAVRHEFHLEGVALLERIHLHNTAECVMPLERLEIGMTWPMTDSAGRLLDSAQKAIWVPIPGRRHPMDTVGGYEQFNVHDLMTRRPDLWFGHSGLNPDGQEVVSHATDGWPADGWCFTVKDHTLVVLKHATEHCEFSVLDTEEQSGVWAVRFGGATLVHASSWHGIDDSMPGKIVALPPDKTITLGLSRYEVAAGNWQHGYAVFRCYFDDQGYRPPKKFNPPVHWNQLYDMTSWHTTRGYSDRRRELYTLEALWKEARKAKEYHCEALYLDPGWDTGFGSAIWDESRLGPQKEFSAKLRKDYGLDLSLHCPLAVWCDASFYPPKSLRMEKQGQRLPGRVCSGSKQYLEVKVERLRRLCEDGAIFLMYDGTAYTGPCFDANHGHPIPYMPDDQAINYRWLCDAVQEKYPDVLIELHDVYAGGWYDAVLPKHFPHKPGWNVENWGNEYMWLTYEDLFTGKMKYLDYVNRAYSIPMYLHIALQTDNEHGLAFWYAASTCRHLGIGGTHPNSQVATAHKGYMAKYRKLKRFFTQGEYFAIDESTHLHVLRDVQEAVLLLFNFTDQSVLRNGMILLPKDVNLSGDLIADGGVKLTPDRKGLLIHTVVPAHGVKVMLLEQRDRVQRINMIW